MASVDLDTMSLDELQKLQKDVDKAISNYEIKRKQEALSAIQALAQEKGFKLDELLTGGGKKTGSKLPPKYRHPENPELTWTGRGRQPGWVKDILARGGNLDDHQI